MTDPCRSPGEYDAMVRTAVNAALADLSGPLDQWIEHDWPKMRAHVIGAVRAHVFTRIAFRPPEDTVLIVLRQELGARGLFMPIDPPPRRGGARAGAGRKAKGPGKRSVHITVNVTPADMDRVRQLAAGAGVPVAQWVYDVIRAASGDPVLTPDAPRAITEA